jgi:insertion element IS1 protein InsB
MVDRLTQWDVQLYCTDKWATYAAVIPQDKLVQSKAITHNIERNHCRQRHWFGRFKRKSIIISKSKEMVDLTMALFAKFWVNGNQDELLSLSRFKPPGPWTPRDTEPCNVSAVIHDSLGSVGIYSLTGINSNDPRSHL